MKKDGRHCRKQWIQSNNGFTLIELIVSVLVSSVIILSAILFFSLALNQYRSTAEETDLMMESQIAVNMVKEVVMEAKETVRSQSFNYGGITYPYIAVRTGSGADVDGNTGVEEYEHLFLLDPVGKVLLYCRQAAGGVSSPESLIQNVFFQDGLIDKEDMKQYFLADHLEDMSLDTANPQLVCLDMIFNLNGRNYDTSETILIRNTLPDSGE